MPLDGIGGQCPGLTTFASNTLRRVKQGNNEVLDQLARFQFWLIPSGPSQSGGPLLFHLLRTIGAQETRRWSRSAFRL